MFSHRCIADSVSPVNQSFLIQRAEALQTRRDIGELERLLLGTRQSVGQPIISNVCADAPVRTLASFVSVGINHLSLPQTPHLTVDQVQYSQRVNNPIRFGFGLRI